MPPILEQNTPATHTPLAHWPMHDSIASPEGGQDVLWCAVDDKGRSVFSIPLQGVMMFSIHGKGHFISLSFNSKETCAGFKDMLKSRRLVKTDIAFTSSVAAKDALFPMNDVTNVRALIASLVQHGMMNDLQGQVFEHSLRRILHTDLSR